MNFERTSFQPLYLSGLLAIALGLVFVTHSIKWFKLNPNPDGWTGLWILLQSMLGAILFQIGIGFCMAWITISARIPGNGRATAIADDKRNSPDVNKGLLEESRSERTASDAIPVSLNDKNAKRSLAALGCTAFATSLQSASTVTRLYDKDGVLAIGTWNCGTAIAATIAHFGWYLLSLYTWCKALKLDDSHALTTYKS